MLLKIFEVVKYKVKTLYNFCKFYSVSVFHIKIRYDIGSQWLKDVFKCLSSISMDQTKANKTILSTSIICWTTEESGFDFRYGREIFVFLRNTHTGFGVLSAQSATDKRKEVGEWSCQLTSI
jgi:hypothetical protein